MRSEASAAAAPFDPTGDGASPLLPGTGGTELQVRHETAYAYGSPVHLAQHIAFLCPRDDGPQRLLDSQLHIEPVPSRLRKDTDVFGNVRTVFSLTAPHESLTVVTSSRVRVFAPPQRGAAALPWEACRDRWRYVSGRAPDDAAEFVFASPMVPLHPALKEWAEASFPPDRPLDEAAIDLMHRLHREFTYAADSTDVDTPLLEAFERREGVCQDFAHILIGSLRTIGIAARYVSGYLLTEPPPGQPRLQGADASHAWVAVALPNADGGPLPDWLELDPTNDCIAATSHVRLAVGRDYGDVTPLRGVIRGGSRHALEVRVDIRPVAG